MKKRLHLSVSKFSEMAQAMAEAEKKIDPKAGVAMKIMTSENGPEILTEIFSADSVCFWNKD